MSKLTETAVKVWPAVKFLLTHKATYRFLGVLLGAFGVSHYDELSDTLAALAASIFGGLE